MGGLICVCYSCLALVGFDFVVYLMGCVLCGCLLFTLTILGLVDGGVWILLDLLFVGFDMFVGACVFVWIGWGCVVFRLGLLDLFDGYYRLDCFVCCFGWLLRLDLFILFDWLIRLWLVFAR